LEIWPGLDSKSREGPMMPRLSHPGQRRQTQRDPRQVDVAPAFTTEAADRTWAGLPPKRNHAAASAFEAALYSLRTCRAAKLQDEKTLGRLAEFSTPQLAQLISALTKLQPQNADTITPGLIASLKELAEC